MIDTNVVHEIPFVGMRPFQEDEWDLLFGQEDAIDDLVNRLGDKKLIAVMGESGCGKSSMVRAGMIPALVGRDRAFSSTSSKWHISVSRPARAPIHNLARKLGEAGLLAGDVVRIESMLRAHSFGLLEVVREAQLARGTRVLVVIDQFEELFRFQTEGRSPDLSERDEAALFIKLLLAAAEDHDLPVYIVLTMRSEYLGDCSSFVGLAEAMNEGAYLLPKMGRAQIEDAIVEPLRSFGQSIENRLLQHLLNETESAQRDGLPLLQHALRRTWEKWKKTGDGTAPLQMEHFAPDARVAGKLDIQKHLNAHLDEIFQALSARQQTMAESMYKLLGEFDHKARLVRRPTDFITLMAVTRAKDPDELLNLINAFREEDHGRCFLRPDQKDDEELLAGRERLDISHEALLRCWKKCADWVKQECQDAEEYRRLADLANHRDTKGVLKDLQLDSALKWLRDARPNEAWAERYTDNRFDWWRTMDYVRKSVRFRRRRRWSVASLAAVVLILLASFGAGMEQQATRKKILEKTAALAAEKEAQARIHAEELRAKNDELAKKQARLATINDKLQESNSDLLTARASLLAQKEALRGALEREKTTVGELKQTNERLKVTQDRLTASLKKEQDLSQWRVAMERKASLESTTRDALTQALPAHWFPVDPAKDLTQAVSAVKQYVKETNTVPSFAAHGLNEAFTRSLAVPIKDGNEFKDGSEPVLAVAVNGDGLGLKVVRKSGFSQPEGPTTAKGQRLSVQRAVVTRDGEYAARGGQGGLVKLEDNVAPLHVHTFAVTGVGFSADQTRLATSSTAGDIKLFRVEDFLRAEQGSKNRVEGAWSLFLAKTGLVIDIIFHHVKGEYPVEHLALSMDGKNGKTASIQEVAAISASGDLWAWAPKPNQRLIRLTDGEKHVVKSEDDRYRTFSALATRPSDQKIWAGASDGAIGTLDKMRFRAVTGTEKTGRTAITALDWDQESGLLAAGDRTGAVTIFQASGGGALTEVIKLNAHDSPVTAVAWRKLSDGRRMLASGSLNGSALLWDLSMVGSTTELNAMLRQLNDRISNAKDHQAVIGESSFAASDYEKLIDLMQKRANQLQQRFSQPGPSN